MGTDTGTLQKSDYTRGTHDGENVGARMYADAWVLPGQVLGYKEHELSRQGPNRALP